MLKKTLNVKPSILNKLQINMGNENKGKHYNATM